MKTIYIRTFIVAGLCAAAASCGENSWNNHLNGFEEFVDQPFSNQQAIEYTLSDDEYSKIASNATNKALAGDEGSEALAQVGTLHRFSAAAPASEYVPAFLASTDFPYYTLSDGSSVKVTYQVAVAEPEELVEAAKVQKYTISEDFYRDDVWGGEDYITAFTPLMPAADYVPVALGDFIDTEKGTYCIVSYNEAQTEPVFGGDQPVQPAGPVEIFAESFTESLGAFTMDDVIMPEALTFVWSWGGANYGAKASAFKDNVSYATESWLISPEIDLAGYTDVTLAFEHVVNKFPDAEFAKANCTLWARESGAAWKQVTIPEYTGNDSWTFGNSGDIKLDAFAGKKIQLGFKYVSEDGKSGTWEVKNLKITGVSGAAKAPARIKANVPYTAVNAVYHFDGSEWAPATGFTVLQNSDYTDMGQKYANLSVAEPYLSRWLDLKYPYGVVDDTKYVYWQQYKGGATNYVCSAYICGEDGKWTPASYVETETSQFVRNNGKWLYNPNVKIYLEAGKSQPLSSLYYQTIVDWVFENICRPLGDTNIKSGLFYVTSYGNNEYYSGASAYQGNVDLRPSPARAQYPAEYGSMTDDEIVELEKNRFVYETLPAALAILNPDAKPLDGVEVLYTITFAAYNGTTTDYYDVIYEVTAPAEFTAVSCTWWENGTGK